VPERSSLSGAAPLSAVTGRIFGVRAKQRKNQAMFARQPLARAVSPPPVRPENLLELL